MCIIIENLIEEALATSSNDLNHNNDVIEMIDSPRSQYHALQGPASLSFTQFKIFSIFRLADFIVAFHVIYEMHRCMHACMYFLNFYSDSHGYLKLNDISLFW